MQRILIAAIVSLAALGVLIAYLTLSRPGMPAPPSAATDPEDATPQPRTVELYVYAAASQQAPVEKIVRQYESEFPGRSVYLDFGPSQTQLSTIVSGGRGDLFIPADHACLEAALEHDLLEETLPLAQMRPLLVVPAGNPLNIESLFDLQQKNARLALASPETAALGRRVQEALILGGLWERLWTSTAIFTGSAVEAADELRLGTVDATIIWDGMLPGYPEFEVVPAPELAGITAHVTVNVLRTCEDCPAALHFARYLAARDKGLAVYRASGFRTVEGRAWSTDENLSP